jgi:3-methyladenine DNA glycosylase AlkD
MNAGVVIRSIQSKANSKEAKHAQRFFKTAKGEYGYGDIFLGVRVPQVRKIATTNKDLDLPQVEKLIASKFHEVRLCGLMILTFKYKSSKDVMLHKKLFNFYLKQLKAGRINNWDLIDVTAPIIGQYLIGLKSSMHLLRKLARSKSLWQRRASIMFTFAYLRVGEVKPTIEISKILLTDDHDLIQKAVGWALREVGKIDSKLLRDFLNKNLEQTPRTTLRYAIEKFSVTERKKWLSK